MRDRRKRKGRLWKWLSWLLIIPLLLSYVSTIVSPADIKWIYLFGISYPFWFLGTLIAFVFFAFRKSRFSFIPLIALVLGWNIHGRYLQLMPKVQEEIPEDSESLRVMSYNVRLFDLYNWSENTSVRDKIFEQIKNEEPDIICFQEFYHTDRKGYFETKDTLLQILPLPYVHEKYTHKMRGQQYFGVATFSRYPIVNQGNIPFETDFNNFCIYTDLLVNEDTIRVYNTHFASIRFQKEDYKFMEDNGGEESTLKGGQRILGRLTSAAVNRSEQCEKVSEHVHSSPYDVILCGDFNDTPVSYTYRTLAKELDDAFIEKGSGIGNTYIGAFPSFRIDYILHRGEREVASFRTLPEKYSDHHAIVADFMK